MLLLILLMMKVLLRFLLKLDDEGSFAFSLKAEFTLPLQQKLKQNHCTLQNCYSDKSILRLLAFKWLYNQLLVEAECSEVVLIWWFAPVKSIRSFFLNLSFWYRYSNNYPSSFNFTGKTVPFPFLFHLFFFRFFLRSVASSSFLLSIVLVKL